MLISKSSSTQDADDIFKLVDAFCAGGWLSAFISGFDSRWIWRITRMTAEHELIETKYQQFCIPEIVKIIYYIEWFIYYTGLISRFLFEFKLVHSIDWHLGTFICN